MKYVCLLALLGATACAPTPDDTLGVVDATDGTSVVADTGVAPDLEECDAVEYRPLIGTPATDTVFAPGERLRVYSEADIVTQEYIPQRTNVVFNTSGKIVRVFCG